MNWEPIKNILMVVLGAIGSWIVQKGWIDNATMLSIVGAIVTIAGGLWAAWKGTVVNQVATTDALPGVKGVVTSPAIANAVPSATVTTTTGELSRTGVA